jgi:hypothetical protein
MQHNKMIYYVSAILAVFSIEALGAEAPQLLFAQKAANTGRNDPDLVKAVDEALEAIRKDAPQVHQDSLRVWKNFKKKSCPPNYTYRFWGIKIILWLKDHKEMAFSSERSVFAVFQILYHKGLISEHAVLLLTTTAWNNLVYREGVPDWEKKYEDRTPEGGFGSETARKLNERET